MWTTDSAKFAKIYQVSNKQARWRQATAEHLIPRSKGGSDRRVNIVAACLFCNSHRHRAKLALDAEAFREKVISRMAGGKRSEEHTSELQSLMRISYAVFCLKKKNPKKNISSSLEHNKIYIIILIIHVPTLLMNKRSIEIISLSTSRQ